MTELVSQAQLDRIESKLDELLGFTRSVKAGMEEVASNPMLKSFGFGNMLKPTVSEDMPTLPGMPPRV